MITTTTITTQDNHDGTHYWCIRIDGQLTAGGNEFSAAAAMRAAVSFLATVEDCKETIAAQLSARN